MKWDPSQKGTRSNYPPAHTNIDHGEGVVLTGQADDFLARSEKGQPRQHKQQPPHRLGEPVTSGHPVERPLALPDLVKR